MINYILFIFEYYFSIFVNNYINHYINIGKLLITVLKKIFM